VITRLWLVGCGNMGGAMLRRWIATGTIIPRNVTVINRADRALPEGVTQGRVFPEGRLPDAVMLAMKPQQIDDVAAAQASRLAGVPILISILAGVDHASLARRFDSESIVRAMPNLPVALGKGVVALHADRVAEDARSRVTALMTPLGLVEWIDDPALFDLVTALAGSGPAFLFRFIDALAVAGATLGLGKDQAARLALATVQGAAAMAANASESPAMLADRVASKGGSTRAGLDVLDDQKALEQLLVETLAAATQRNAEMAAAAR